MASFFVDFQLGLKVNTVVCDITQWHADHNFRKQGTWCIGAYLCASRHF